MTGTKNHDRAPPVTACVNGMLALAAITPIHLATPFIIFMKGVACCSASSRREWLVEWTSSF